jgi:hypothetical protein
MTSSIFLFALLLAAVLSVSLTTAHAQATAMTKPINSNPPLDIRVDPQLNGSEGKVMVSFLKQGTETIQQHIDYNVVVNDKDGKQIFSAAQGDQPLLHTAEGAVTIPVQFPGNGQYDIEVSVAGILFVPMNTETATFSVTVTPEFPVGVVGAVTAALVGTTVIVSRKFSIGFKI